MINLNMDSMMSNFTKSLKTLEVTMPKPLLSKDSANSFPKKLPEENWPFDLLFSFGY
jgi:hypothetical protein